MYIFKTYLRIYIYIFKNLFISLYQKQHGYAAGLVLNTYILLRNPN